MATSSNSGGPELYSEADTNGTGRPQPPRGIGEALDVFLNRPLGGLELEIFLSLVELGCGLQLVKSEFSLLESRSLELYYGWISSSVVSIPWFVASILSLFGIYLFFRGDSRCAILRWVGACISTLIWTWIFVSCIQNTGGFYPTLALSFYAGSILASLRIMIGAWRRIGHNKV